VRTIPVAGLTIGDLAQRTGVSPATLRAWETRHGFPRPQRLDSGHRRYDEGEVALVRQVLRRRESGVRLDTAVAEALASAPAARRTPAVSVFAELRHRHPGLPTRPLRKSTLLALTWAIEDECCARAQQPLLFGAFQHERFFESSRRRWADLARTARETVVFAQLGADPVPPAGVTFVPLPDGTPMRREWSLVCEAADHPAALSAWELPGQEDVPDGERVFETAWTLDPLPVRTAAGICVEVAARLSPGVPVAPDLADAPAPLPASDDLAAATSMFARLLAYVDRVR
jgi:MerR family transcriptional regulator, light-induced transcriptional regulator